MVLNELCITLHNHLEPYHACTRLTSTFIVVAYAGWTEDAGIWSRLLPIGALPTVNTMLNEGRDPLEVRSLLPSRSAHAAASTRWRSLTNTLERGRCGRAGPVRGDLRRHARPHTREEPTRNTQSHAMLQVAAVGLGILGVLSAVFWGAAYAWATWRTMGLQALSLARSLARSRFRRFSHFYTSLYLTI